MNEMARLDIAARCDLSDSVMHVHIERLQQIAAVKGISSPCQQAEWSNPEGEGTHSLSYSRSEMHATVSIHGSIHACAVHEVDDSHISIRSSTISMNGMKKNLLD